MIIPSIDLIQGKAVQLVQGKEKILERNDVLGIARTFNLYGEIAVIDLDSTFSQGNNLELIREITKIADVRIGGGIRSLEKAEQILAYGPKKIIIGTKASPEFLSVFDKSRIIVAVDSIGENIVENGWRTLSSTTTIDKMVELEDYCSEFLYTDVIREGLQQGINLEKIKKLKNATGNNFTYAGGITTVNDYLALEHLGINSQIGMSLYTGNFNLSDAFIATLDFEKQSGLIPTIVQDLDGNVLMMAYSSITSLKLAFRERRGVYFSRSRKEIWRKGEISGNIQNLIKVRSDCDYDTLLFTVLQSGNSCHKGSGTCFGSSTFSLSNLYDILESRILNPVKNSYTSNIGDSEEAIRRKILEEAYEVVNYTDERNLVWELADLSYFLLLLMAKKGIRIADIRNELWRRRK